MSTPRDLGALYARDGPGGGEAIAPAILCGLWCDGDATGPFSARKRARAPDESRPCPGLAGRLPPAHDPLANFRNTFLPDRKDLLGPLLLYAQAMGGLTWGTSRLDGTTIPAEASTRQAMRDQRRLERDRPLRAEGAKWFARTEPAEPTERPAGVVIAAASAFGQERLANLAQAPAG